MEAVVDLPDYTCDYLPCKKLTLNTDGMNEDGLTISALTHRSAIY
jgi:hypothetical protein